MFTLRAAKCEDLARNFEIWRTSVLATHQFLSAEDFDEFSELVAKSYLPTADFTVAVDADDTAHGFMGTTGDHVDALFVHADSRGQGIGQLLLHSFLAPRSEATVDVNEQNASAKGFYEAMGFDQQGRSDTDSEGRPYPILHMRWRRERDPTVKT
ncbi:acetyltransferase [Sinorhizobium prairiense]|uniref:acetyltransferase n=1 Tax=unclassified Sinorhizobium TaxID=2613772 RepID=UPI0023D7F775|nr:MULTISPECIES: acetyltransferase [unclassified Sinorhizobium]WEJ13238.1 acetyltransferase [Sinorhizobium sp. M103]WEJ18326.1 acetyltransferase [Sinorhizobium sp. K101]WEJ39728.1 acetyltransferase [Sinorhizobium sp. C101]